VHKNALRHLVLLAVPPVPFQTQQGQHEFMAWLSNVTTVFYWLREAAIWLRQWTPQVMGLYGQLYLK
jgi:hypothetical protein